MRGFSVCWFLHGGMYRRQAFMRDDMATVTWHVGESGGRTTHRLREERQTARERKIDGQPEKKGDRR